MRKTKSTNQEYDTKMKNQYTITCKTVCKSNELKNNSGASHLVGCHSQCERKLITWRWRSSKGRRLAFVDSSSFQHFQTIRKLSIAF